MKDVAGKFLCQITKGKALDYFSPSSILGCLSSCAEKIVHGLRSCIDEHRNEKYILVMKINLCNAINLVSSGTSWHFLSSSSELHGATVNAICFGLQWKFIGQNLESNSPRRCYLLPHLIQFVMTSYFMPGMMPLLDPRKILAHRICFLWESRDQISFNRTKYLE